MRDDFSKDTKEKLAKRVGYCCSICGNPTTGPSQDLHGVTLIGEAAHICAASPGGPRYNANMTSLERKSFDNGIWLCKKCARIIDRDTVRYSVEKLKKIKNQAEQRAYTELTSGSPQRSTASDNAKNSIIADLRVLFENGEILREEYLNYKPATIEANDIRIYNVCVAIYNACARLLYEESQNHIQLMENGLDGKIFELRDMLPKFYNDQGDWTGTQLIATTCDYTKFFASDEGHKFITKCKKLIKDIESL